MAKDTEKLIRQLSLISYLMAERRPVTALEIRRDVEGYSGMNEDAFARRFYADRSELESLRIQLTVERPTDGAAEQENYSLRPENFHLPAIEFTDKELAALQTALQPARRRIRLRRAAAPGAAADHLGAAEPAAGARAAHRGARDHRFGGRARADTAPGEDRDGDLPQQDDPFDYYTMERDEVGARRVDPYHLLFQGGAFYLLGHCHERKAMRVFRLSRIRGKVSYATKAEHDFRRPADFDPRAYANRADWQLGERRGVAEIQVSERIAWQIERHFGRFGEIRATARTKAATRVRDPYASPRRDHLVGARARRATPASSRPRSWSRSSSAACELIEERHRRAGLRRAARRRRAADAARRRGSRARAREPPSGDEAERPRRGGHPPRALRPPGHAREHPDRRRARRRAVAIARGLRAPADHRGRAARGHQRAERRELRRRLVRAVRRGRTRTSARSRSTPSPTATTSTAPPACCRSRPRRWSRRST